MTLWYLARATGLVALIAFTVSTMLGALASTAHGRKSTTQLDRRFLQQMAHRSAAVTGLVMLLAHTTFIVVDSFVNVSVSGALVPFTAGYRPLAVGLGTLAVYSIVSVAVSGAMRGRLATSDRAARRWRAVHLLAYVGWALAMGHGILAGTDTGQWWSTAIYVVCGAAVAVAASLRLRSEILRRSHGMGAARARLRESSAPRSSALT